MAAVHIKIPMPNGVGMIDATTSEASAITEVQLNGIAHVGLVLHNSEQTVMAVLTPDEAMAMSQGLQFAAIGLGKRWAAGKGPQQKEDPVEDPS